ncbi:MAG: hypothetical protein HN564_03395 [Flavobacteriales bacterium]|jgi:hypothetical protein|nr:hypothetical protein [Flavobacteriales bacterium]
MEKFELKLKGLESVEQKLDYLIEAVKKTGRSVEHEILDNKGLMEYLKISATKAQKLRNEGKLSFSKDSRTGKIWFRLSDVLVYLDSCYYKRF